MEVVDIEQLICQRLNERKKVIREKLEFDQGIISAQTEKFNILVKDGSSKAAVGKFLENLINPVDITFAFFALPYSSFREGLEERRKVAWLPEVLQILRKRKRIYEIDSDGKQRINCLGLRGVSKSFTEIADTVFFESSFLDPLWYMHIDYATDWRVKLFKKRSQFTHWNVTNADVTVLKHNSQVDRALEYFPCQNDISPSLFRKLYVDHKSYYQDEDAVDNWPLIVSSAKLWQSHRQSLDNVWNFEKKLIEFLDVHGSSVWLFVYNPTLLPERKYLQLYDLILRMPNLKGLVVLNPKKVYLANYALCPTPVGTAFPFAGSLKYLRCDADMRQINVFDRLIDSCVNIKNLKVDEYVLFKLEGHPLEKHANKVDLCLERLRSFPNLPLKSLIIENFSYSEEDYIFMPYLWCTLNRYGDTLTDLTIYACIKRSQNSSMNSIKLNLPNLKHLKLWDNKFGRLRRLTFDDLILLKSLEKVRIEMDWNEDFLNRQIGHGSVEIGTFRSKLHRSNIWSIFPNLKEVEFRNTSWDEEQNVDYPPKRKEIHHAEKEVRYVRAGNNITRFKTCRFGNGLKKTEHKLGGWGCNVV